ncbi:hypothetical protein B0H11DRAFT_2374948 [Mycena galericulata]|nr:hypothetical protein B0H11DRAFT_2374948 [Mycena galericulata]
MSFSVRHIPALVVATGLTFGGLIPFFNAEYACQAFGLPQRIAASKPAQSVMILSTARGTTIGLAIFVFYAQGNMVVVDTLLTLLAYVGAVDGYVCWKEGVPGKAVFRASCATFFAAWGALRMTQG